MMTDRTKTILYRSFMIAGIIILLILLLGIDELFPQFKPLFDNWGYLMLAWGLAIKPLDPDDLESSNIWLPAIFTASCLLWSLDDYRDIQNYTTPMAVSLVLHAVGTLAAAAMIVMKAREYKALKKMADNN